jgi:formate hydrogenlyase subunit 4
MHLLNSIIHIALFATMPPLLLGVINRTKARFAGRSGPPLLQVYYDLFKLARKGMVQSKTTTWIFLAGPVVGMVGVLLASLLVPLGRHEAPISFAGDMLLVAYLLALGRFWAAMAALDTGSAFEGMGAAREVTFSSLAEPALFFGFIVMSKLTSSMSLSAMFAGPMADVAGFAGAALPLVCASWFLVLLAENSRIPFDDPETHLELTMIHEVIVLDHSGPALGMIVYGSAVKLFLMCALLLNVLIPFSTHSAALDWIIFVLAMCAMGALIGLVESIMARVRLVNVPKLLICACLLSAFGMMLTLRT